MSRTKFGPRIRGELIPLVIPGWTKVITKGFKNQTDVITTTSGPNGAPPNALNGQMMYDIVTKDWKKLQSDGKIVNNPMQKSVAWSEVIRSHNGALFDGHTTNPNPLTGMLVTQRTDNTGWLPGNYSRFPAVDQLPLDYLIKEAVNQAYANAHQRNVLGLVDIAEAGKTYDMIRTNLGRLDSAMSKGLFKTIGSKGLRMKGNPKAMQYKAKTALGYTADAAGLWLEANYGVIPLVLSLNGLVKTLTADVSDAGMQSKWAQTFRGSKSLSLSDYVTNDYVVTIPGYDAGANQYTESYTVSASQNCYVRAGVMTRYKPSVQAMLGLELRDVVPGAYELIPFSFVLDWFFNINNYLEAVTPVKGFTSTASWYTLHKEIVLQYIYAETAANLVSTQYRWTDQKYAVDTEVVTGLRFSERRPGAVPLPPEFNSDLQSLTHFISGAAIAFSKVMNSRTFRKSLTK